MAKTNTCAGPLLVNVSMLEGVLDDLDQTSRDNAAALNLMRKLLKKYDFVSDRLVTES